MQQFIDKNVFLRGVVDASKFLVERPKAVTKHSSPANALDGRKITQIESNHYYQLSTVFFIVGGVILLIELTKAFFEGRLFARTVKEMLVSASTLVPYLLVSTTCITVGYGIYAAIASNIIWWHIPTSALTIVFAVVLADFIHYWEHRIAHEVRILWTQHAVHHSLRDFNILTGVRCGPLEPVWTVIMHLPMAFMGFAPELILLSYFLVEAYQAWIHTELIERIKWLDGWMNTPSNHRVHHGSDDKYLDKNYGGILIIWDRLHGTFQPEEETPKYGLKREFKSHNPIRVWFSETPDLWRDLRNADTISAVLGVLFERK